MTTPAHCTRTDPHEPHPEWKTNVPGVRWCPGVEPPADDRLRCAGCGRGGEGHPSTCPEWRKRILDALDAMRTDENRCTLDDCRAAIRAYMSRLTDQDCSDEDLGPTVGDLGIVPTYERPADTTPAGLSAEDRHVEHRAQEHLRRWLGDPAGLSAAQEIRLRLAEMWDGTDGDGPESIGTVLKEVLNPLAAWVEHGPDERVEGTGRGGR